MNPSDIRKSLEARAAKVWVRQGLWVRRAKLEKRHLLVAHWQEQESSRDKKERTLARYGSKAPQGPSEIEYIGAWISKGRSVSGKPTDSRPRQINKCGFT
jgi:hypothetical protein